MLRAYIWLTKPGIIIGNLITAAGGFLLASKGDVNPWRLAATLGGTALVIACACVINNYIDRGIDARMSRTRKRALVQGTITPQQALLYAVTLGIVGFAVLAAYTNTLTVATGGVGMFFYLVMYGIWKRRSTLGTVVGSIAGATPILAGYLAASNTFDVGAVLVFLILVLWQMPHFYAIAMYRHTDYAAAGLPVLPVRRGMAQTKQYILLYIGAFVAATCLLTTYGYAGLTYLAVVATFGSLWFWRGAQGLKRHDDVTWAREMFQFSLRVIMIFSIMISVDAFLP